MLEVISKQQFYIDPVRSCFQKGSTEVLPSGLNFEKLVFGMLLGQLQGYPHRPSIIIADSGSVVRHQTLSVLDGDCKICHSISSSLDLVFQSLKSEKDLIFIVGRHETPATPQSDDYWSNMSKFISLDWSHHPPPPLTCDPVIIEEKPGKFRLVSLHSESLKIWKKKEIPATIGFGIAGFCLGRLSQPNVVWNRLKLSSESIDLGTVDRILFEGLAKSNIDLESDDFEVWLECEDLRMLALLCKHSSVGKVFCPQLAYGYHPSSSILSALKFFKPVVLIIVNFRYEVDVVVVG